MEHSQKQLRLENSRNLRCNPITIFSYLAVIENRNSIILLRCLITHNGVKKNKSVKGRYEPFTYEAGIILMRCDIIMKDIDFWILNDLFKPLSDD